MDRNYSAFGFLVTGIQPIIPKGHPLTHVPAGRADVRPTKYKFTCGEGAGFSLHHTFLRTLQQVQSPMAELLPFITYQLAQQASSSAPVILLQILL